MLKIRACFWRKPEAFLNNLEPDYSYTLDHDNDVERRTLGMRCSDAFKDGWVVATYPVTAYKANAANK